MALVTSQGFDLVPDLNQSVQSGLQTAANVQGLQANKQAMAARKFANLDAETQTGLKNFSIRSAQALTLPQDQVENFLQTEVSKGSQSGIDMSDTQGILNTFRKDPQAGMAQLQKTAQFGQQLGFIEAPQGSTGASPDEVKSSKINEDGSATIVTKGGQVKVVELTDQEKGVIDRANELGVDLQQRRAQGRGLGKDAAGTANKAFEQTGKLRANNISLRKVISEVKGGAETGPLAAKMPSFRAASVRLDTLKNQLGLDVVGSVTFGALSEGELNLALNTALPTNLEGPELVKWAEDKINAQEKLSSYLEDQAIFISQPGNTQADWLIKVRSQPEQSQQNQAAPAQLPPTNAQGWQLMTDAQGNKAYVSPDGQIEEVQ